MALHFTFKKIVPPLLLYFLLFVGAIFLDYLLHLAGLAWVGKYMGIVGTLLILLSFLYSLNKRKKIKFGNPKKMLTSHEVLSWGGALMILVHGGIHFNAIIPWAALILMVVVVASGFVGRHLLKDARDSLAKKHETLVHSHLSKEEMEKELFAHSVIVDTMQKWRSVHLPLTVIFGALALLHIISILFLWRW